jgi:opacity protein-like surface antigen
MSVRKFIISSVLVLMASAVAPSKASADWLLTPFVGWNWGGTANFPDFPDFDDKFEQRVNFGVSFGWMGAGVIGWEIDLGFSPNFFENTAGPGNFEFGDSNVTTLMGNLVLGVPLGGQKGPGFRPYAVGGLGLIKSRIGDADDLFNVDATDWGFNAGAGAYFFFTDGFGLRADIRYFRSLQDNEPDDELDVAFGDFRFWRGTFGATFRF